MGGHFPRRGRGRVAKRNGVEQNAFCMIDTHRDTLGWLNWTLLSPHKVSLADLSYWLQCREGSEMSRRRSWVLGLRAGGQTDGQTDRMKRIVCTAW